MGGGGGGEWGYPELGTGTPGCLPNLQYDRLWRIMTAPLDAEVHCPYGGPEFLQLNAEA